METKRIVGWCIRPVSLAAFAFGAWALYTERGVRRDCLLAIAVGVLALMAVIRSQIGRRKR